MVVAVGRFNYKFHVLVNLLLLYFRADGFNHVAAGQNFIQHTFAENPIPAAGAAGRDTANDNLLAAGSCGGGFFGGRGGQANGCLLLYPIYKGRIIGVVIAVDIRAGPIQMDARGNQVGKQIVKFHNAAFFGVVGRQDFNVFFVRERIGSQGRQDALGAALHKQAHAGIVSGFKLFNPLHRAGNLLNH